MAQRWYYSRGGTQQGPCTAQELRELAQTGGLAPADLIWPADKGPAHAVLAESALSFPLPAESAAVPDWLQDVQAREQHTGPHRHDWSTTEMPAWVDDQRRLQGLPPLTKVMAPPRVVALQDLYQRAQANLQQWADLDVNRELICDGVADELRRDVALQAILGPLQPYGPALVERYWRHVDLVVLKRRRYYQALAPAK
jgi:hypothetical protein